MGKEAFLIEILHAAYLFVEVKEFSHMAVSCLC